MMLSGEHRPRFLPKNTRYLMRLRFPFPGWLEFVLLLAITSQAISALGIQPENLGRVGGHFSFGAAVYGALLLLVILSTTLWINHRAKSWQQSVQYTLVLAVLAMVVWVIASVVRG